jgi:Uma2 family endonuclease
MLNLEKDKQDEEMPSLNHSYICLQILRQLLQNENVEPLPELTLDIANGLTPDISIFPKEQIHPNFFRDVSKFQQMPVLAIEVISSSQTIEELLEKAAQLIQAGVKAVWTIEPHSRSVFVTTSSEEKLFHDGIVEDEEIQVDFAKVFCQQT